MNDEKKVIIFIVEGGSDKIFFGEYKKIFLQHHVLIHVVKGDIFSNRQLKKRSSTSVIKGIVNKVINDNSVLGITREDVQYVYQITDTDCCFQKDKFENDSLAVIRKTKAEKINAIVEMQRYTASDKRTYELLYLSPNLEGALTPNFDNTNADGVDKSLNMLNLIKHLNKTGNIKQALNEIVSTDKIAPFDEYFKSWDFIRCDNNCQKPYTNLKFVTCDKQKQ